MAHELTTTNGVTEMAYVGEVPWHGLGQQLQPGASIEEWIRAAGMEWHVRKVRPFYHPDRAETAEMRAWEERRILIRSDNGNPLGIVTPEYQIVQPSEVLEFFRDLTADYGFQLETAGTMFGGRRYWALAKVTEQILSGWDKIGGYLLLTTSADGSFASELRETMIRVVCNNTLSMAVAQNPGKHYMKINHKNAFDSKAIKAQMGLTGEHFAKMVELSNALTKAKVSSVAAEDFVMRLLRSPVDDQDVSEEEQQEQRKPRGFDMILGLFEGAGQGADKKGAKGTAWGLVNAVTEYVDHLRTAKSVDHRLQSAWWGSGDELKTAAFDAAYEEFIG